MIEGPALPPCPMVYVVDAAANLRLSSVSDGPRALPAWLRPIVLRQMNDPSRRGTFATAPEAVQVWTVPLASDDKTFIVLVESVDKARL